MQSNWAILRMLAQHKTTFAVENDYLQLVQEFVQRNANCWHRTNQAGHLTGSAWVLSPDGGSVLLIHHKKLDRWLQPGGHVDAADPTLAHTAQREAMEECGLRELILRAPQLFDVDVHEIPARGAEPAHFHYDFRFAFKVESREFVGNFSEIKDIRWVPVQHLVGHETEQSMRRMAAKTLDGHLGGWGT